jgi:hypothetical protein
MWIKAKNGNVIEIDDVEHALRAVADGHDVFESDPRDKGAKPWKPAKADDAGDNSE